MKKQLKVNDSQVQIAKVVGENEDGLTLFVPKDMSGTFHLSEGDRFLTLVFMKTDGVGSVKAWIPWEGE
jgi:hypothetical protein